ncbi:hypothetical protein [Exiguobacterium sp. AM39-5BH]|uniref:hypothetical protein n=1 Tax=Exiguobacterium sp. AM39-5BH TaxID=2292355 RepID=UPI000FE191D1|nr:hypothetical protein [Exiguobacterium sp. AM39-5BH]RHB50537.1 hypothetical protein DW881_05135 [Exiguobacterium sp. AM39-5BH]
MKRQLRSKYGLVIIVGMLMISIAYSTAFAKKIEIEQSASPIIGEVKRTISPITGWVGSEFTLTYTFDLNMILNTVDDSGKKSKGPDMNSYALIEWDAEFVETIPVGFDVPKDVNLPEGFHFDRDKRTLTGNINIVCGKKKAGIEKKCNDLQENEIIQSFSIPLSAKEPGSYSFDTGKYKYTFYADHAGQGSIKHNRSYENNPGALSTEVVTVKGIDITIPNNLTLYVGEETPLRAKFSPDSVSDSAISWEVVDSDILKLKTNEKGSATIEAKKVGETIVRATYKYPNGYIAKSNDLRVDVKLPKLTVTPETTKLWVYLKDGEIVKQTKTLTLNQFKDDNSAIAKQLNATWTSNSSAISLSPDGAAVVVQAEHGSQGNVEIVGQLADFSEHSKTASVYVNEYPQKVSTPNVVLYMSQSPYTYPVKFWPETANVTGYGLTVLEGTDVMTAKDGVLTLLKPGIAKIILVTEDVSKSFERGEGPKVISQTFYVRVKAGTDPNPGTEDPSGDFY